MGKCVNLLRKKTDNVQLAKRAKNLVKRWRDLVGDLTGASQQNGATVMEKKSAVAIEPLVEPVPRTHAANKRLRKTYDDENERSENYEPQKKKARINGLTRSQPVIEADANAAGECSVAIAKELPVPVELFKPAEVPDEEPAVVEQPPPGPKKRGRKKGSKNRSTLLKAAGIKKPDDDIIKEKIASISRTPKVKTTQELVAALGSKTSDILDIGAKPASSTPVTKERSSSLKNSVSKLETDQSLSRNSSKYLSRLAYESESSKRRDELRPVDREDDKEPGSPIIVVDNVPEDEETSPSSRIPDKLVNPPPPEEPPPVVSEPSKFSTVQEIMSQLPPVDVDAINWDETPVPSPPQSPIATPEDLEQLHSEFVEGLNGVWEHSQLSSTQEQTSDTTFREWHEMVHRRSYRDELLRILPYTVID